jgi:kynurenine formamidase
MRHYFLRAVIAVAIMPVLLSACSSTGRQAITDLSQSQWVDLSHSYDASTLYWPNNIKGFEHVEEFKGTTPGNYFYSSYSISTPEHGGTHLDAPIHFSEKGLTLDQIPLSSLTGNAIVVDVSAKASRDRDYLIGVDDLIAWEQRNGQIPTRSIILFKTGYGSKYPSRKEYFGTEKTGPEAIPELHFPGISAQASTWLVDHRQPKAVGIDTASIDYGQSTDFQTHRILLGNNIPGFENLANLDALPVTGAYVVALPMKIAGGSGGPLRIVAAVPKATGQRD